MFARPKKVPDVAFADVAFLANQTATSTDQAINRLVNAQHKAVQQLFGSAQKLALYGRLTAGITMLCVNGDVSFCAVKRSVGAAGGDRTHDPWLRRPILYPLSYSRNAGVTDCSLQGKEQWCTQFFNSNSRSGHAQHKLTDITATTAILQAAWQDH